MTMERVFVVVCILFCVQTGLAQRGNSCPAPDRACEYDITSGFAEEAKVWNENAGKADMSAGYPKDRTTVDFIPKRPGAYTFEFESRDLCTSKRSSTVVHARCPPSPRAVIKMTPDKTEFNQFERITISSTGSGPASGFDTSMFQMRYNFSLVVPDGVPANSELRKPLVSVADPDGTMSVVIREELLEVAGQYRLQLEVDDGCSSTVVVRCFTVKCNCGPTANAGATPTIWSNNAQGNNRNFAGPGNRFVLDGSLSYDFDLYHTNTERLSYTWTFVEWTPANPLAYATHFNPTCQSATQPFSRLFGTGGRSNPYYNSAPTEKQGTWSAGMSSSGYQVETLTAGTVQTIVFKKLAPKVVSETTNITRFGRPTTETKNEPNEFPLWVPRYNNNPGKSGAEENFMDWSWDQSKKPAMTDASTTSCMAWVENVVTVTATTTNYTEEVTTTTPPQPPDTLYCMIKINQASRYDPKAYLTLEWPQAGSAMMKNLVPYWSNHHSFEYCRGLWKFNLTVMDRCGPQNAATDQIMLTVRCNHPPVAVVGAKTTVVFKAELGGNGGFEQVTVDGRGSYDADNVEPGYLVYYWSFLEYPIEHKQNCRVDVPCKQQYCQNVVNGGQFVTIPFIGAGTGSDLRTFGNASRRIPPGGGADLVGITAFDDTCAPTVYPIIYDTSVRLPQNCIAPGSGTLPAGGQWCYYPAVPNTQTHVGNSAYFTPTAPGTYTVQLAVFDGCSTSVDTVQVQAVCPSVSANIVLDSTEGIYAGSGSTKAVGIQAFVSYGNPARQDSLVYKWLVEPTTGTITEPGSLQTSFAPTARGDYRFRLQVNDGCRTYISPFSQTYRVTCNNPPSRPTVTATPQGALTGAVPLLLKNNTNPYSFDAVTMTAASTDSDGDTVEFEWNVLQVNADGATSAVSGNAANVQYPNQQAATNRNNVLIFQPKSTEPARSYRFVVRATDGCSDGIAQTATVTYQCDQSLTARLEPAGPTITREYSFTQPVGFPPVNFNTAQSVIPYKNRQKFSWCIYPQGSSCANNDPQAVQASGNNGSPTLTFTPSQLTLETYMVQLTVSDECTTSSVDLRVTTTCPSRPTAELEPDSTVIEWNSFATSGINGAQMGAFPPVTLDAQKSTFVAGATDSRYVLDVVNSADSDQKPTQQGQAGLFTFTPTEARSYAFSLQVFNGPCGSSNQKNVEVTFLCMAINPTLRQVPSEGRVEGDGGTLQMPTHNWDGVRFKTAFLDGTGLTYRTNGDAKNAGNQPGNFNALKYTWTITESPANSVFLSGPDTVDQQEPVIQGNAKTVMETTANYTRQTTEYTMVQETRVTAVKTTLFNHHYNKPMTCFKPDVVGTYKVLLTIDDGCKTVSMTAILEAACPMQVNPTVSIVAPGNRQMTLSGTQYQRVHFDGRATEPRGQSDTLTYSWTLQKPEGSQAEVANANGNICSIVPDLEGKYILTMTVEDGCNDPVSQSITLEVSCQGDEIITKNAIVRVGPSVNGQLVASDEIYWRNSTAAATPGGNGFMGAFFQLTGESDTDCTVKSRRWFLSKRDCTPSYSQAPATPAPLAPGQEKCESKYECDWRLLKLPCDLTDNWEPPVSVTKKLATEGDQLVLIPALRQECRTRFQCMTPGTYVLGLTVTDGCSIVSKNMTVTCRCETVPVVSTGADSYEALFKCQSQAEERPDFNEVLLNGEGSTIEVRRTGLELASCPRAAPAAPQPAPPPPAGSCCPAHPPCPKCPECPQCPVCPSYDVSGAQSGAANVDSYYQQYAASSEQIRQRAFYEAQSQQDKLRGDKLPLSAILGVAIPISSVTVLSIMANLLLQYKINVLKKGF